jgi:hypothetical protein
MALTSGGALVVMQGTAHFRLGEEERVIGPLDVEFLEESASRKAPARGRSSSR